MPQILIFFFCITHVMSELRPTNHGKWTLKVGLTFMCPLNEMIKLILDGEVELLPLLDGLVSPRLLVLTVIENAAALVLTSHATPLHHELMILSFLHNLLGLFLEALPLSLPLRLLEGERDEFALVSLALRLSNAHDLVDLSLEKPHFVLQTFHHCFGWS